MSGTANPIFRPDFRDYAAPPQNRLASGFNAIWPASNPVGTETTQGMQSATPVDQIAFMRPDGTPVMQSDVARAHEQVQTAMQVAPTMALGMMGTTAPGVRAFHGSPYDFERFDPSKIGTGEGAQAYGHGLYFAEKEATARSYRDSTSDAGATVGGQPYDPTNISHVASYYINELGGGDRAATLQRIADESNQMQAKIDGLKSMYPTVTDEAVMNGIASPYVTAKQRLGMVRDLVANDKQPLGAYVPPGKMYEVNIGADPAHFLHWDKPLSEQSQHVQEQLAGLNVPNAPHVTGEMAYHHVVGSALLERDMLQKMMRDRAASGDTRQFLGDAQRLTLLNNPQAAAASDLRDAGIPGIRYLDQGSRGAGEGTHNYVVFDANTIDILRKYGLAGLMAGGGAAAAGSQQQSQ